MGLIQKLPEEIAVKIAAGEVVERPASVIKELIENALDAEATQVDILVEDGGRTKIQIRDNGKGMDKDDAEAAFLRHGTSKIRSLDDLHNLVTLGFRGEALATIGATAMVELETALPGSSAGHKVTMAFGDLNPAKPHPPMPGTTVTVTRLFEAIPARFKFLKSDTSEWKACLEIIVRQLVTHPEVGFTVKHNQKEIYNLPAKQSFADRVAAVWHIDSEQLIAIDTESPHLQLKGVVGKPELAHEGKARQYLAVNGHPVADRAIARAIKEAFGTLLPPGMQPSYALDLQIHPGMVDVNIHPRKEEVRFVNGQEVFRFVLQAVSQAVMSRDVSFTGFVSRPIAELTPRPEPFSPLPMSRSESILVSRPAPSLPLRHEPPRRTGFHETVRSPLILPSLLSHESPVLSLDNCFLITLHENQLLVIDQHAAHERVLYNRLWQQDAQNGVAHQSLLIPHPLNLNPEDMALLESHQDAMRELGFAFDFDNVSGVPAGIKSDAPRQLFLQVLHHLDEDRSETELTTAKHRRFATLACKAAVKAGDVLSSTEQKQLIADLLSDEGGFTCPHGRPTHVFVSPEELEKLFKRTGF